MICMKHGDCRQRMPVSGDMKRYTEGLNTRISPILFTITATTIYDHNQANKPPYLSRIGSNAESLSYVSLLNIICY